MGLSARWSRWRCLPATLPAYLPAFCLLIAARSTLGDTCVVIPKPQLKEGSRLHRDEPHVNKPQRHHHPHISPFQDQQPIRLAAGSPQPDRRASYTEMTSTEHLQILVRIKKRSPRLHPRVGPIGEESKFLRVGGILLDP